MSHTPDPAALPTDPITLLVGPVASAKTQHARAAFAAVATGRAVLILPERTQRDDMQAQLAQAGELDRRSVLTLEQFVRQITADAHLPDLPIGGIARALQIRATVRELLAAEQLPTLHPVALKPGMLANLSHFLHDLASSQTDPAHLAQAALFTYDSELSGLAQAYTARLQAQGLADDDRLLALATSTVAAYPRLVQHLELVILDSFDQFTPAQIALLLTLAQHGIRILITLTGEAQPRPALVRFERTRATLVAACAAADIACAVQHLPAPAYPPNDPVQHLRAHLFALTPPVPITANGFLTCISAADREREVRAVLRHVAAWLAQGMPANQIGIVVRQSGTVYTPLLREVASEYGIPLHVVAGRPLLELPALVARMNVLRLPLERWHPANMAEVWRSIADGRVPSELLPPTCQTIPAPLTSYEQLASMLDRLVWLHGTQSIAHVERVLHELITQADTLPETAAHADAVEAEDEDHPERNLALNPAQATALLTVIAAFQAWLQPPPHAGYAARTQWAIARTVTPIDLDSLSDAERQAWQQQLRADDPALHAWYTSLMQLSEAAELAEEPDPDYPTFISELAAVLRGSSAPDNHPDGVQVLTTTAIRGRVFAGVAMLGLIDGDYPQTPSELPFYTRSERAMLRRHGIPLPMPHPADERTLFYEAVTRANARLILSRPYLDERGNLLPASPYLHAVEQLYHTASIIYERITAGALPTPATAQSLPEAWIALLSTDAAALPNPLPARLVQAANDPRFALIQQAVAIEQHREGTAAYGAYEGKLDDADLIAALAELYGPEHAWSVTQLNDYITCPFRFGAGHLLRLSYRPNPSEGLDRAGVGRLYHAILQQAGAAWRRDQLALTADHSPAILAALETAIADVLARAPTDYGFEPGVFWAWERQDVQRRLTRAVRRMLASKQPYGAPQIAAVEQTFGMGQGVPALRLDTPHGVVRLRGRIDRIDQFPDQSLAVIDYKSSSTPRKLEDLVNARDVQAGVYLLAAQAMFAPNQQAVHEVRFFHLGSGQFSGAFEADRNTVSVLRERIGAVLAGVQAGDLSVRPSTECPPTCAYMTICRRNLAKRDAHAKQE